MIDLPPNAVLIPIDMQRAFDEPSWPKRWNDSLDRKGRMLLDAWRRAGRPIIHVRHDSIAPGSTLRPDQPGNAHRPGFEPHEGEPLVTKSVNAAFIGTDLDLRLRRMRAETIVLFGLTTDMCVSTTARVGANLGYRVVVVEDACDCSELPGRDGQVIPAGQVHSAHIATLAAEFAEVTTTTDIISSLSDH